MEAIQEVSAGYTVSCAACREPYSLEPDATEVPRCPGCDHDGWVATDLLRLSGKADGRAHPYRCKFPAYPESCQVVANAPKAAGLHMLVTVRCLECGGVYSKPGRGGTVDENPGCPACGYVGWLPVNRPGRRRFGAGPLRPPLAPPS